MFSAVVVGAQMRAAMLTAAATAINDATVYVVMGTPGPESESDGPSQDIVSVGAVQSDLQAGPMGSQRSMDEHLTCAVHIRCDRAGGDQDAEREASDRVVDLAGRLETYLRTVDPYLGGVVQRAWVSGYVWATQAWYDDDSDSPHVRTAELQLTVSAWQRVQIL